MALLVDWGKDKKVLIAFPTQTLTFVFRFLATKNVLVCISQLQPAITRLKILFGVIIYTLIKRNIVEWIEEEIV